MLKLGALLTVGFILVLIVLCIMIKRGERVDINSLVDVPPAEYMPNSCEQMVRLCTHPNASVIEQIAEGPGIMSQCLSDAKNENVDSDTVASLADVYMQSTCSNSCSYTQCE